MTRIWMLSQPWQKLESRADLMGIQPITSKCVPLQVAVAYWRPPLLKGNLIAQWGKSTLQTCRDMPWCFNCGNFVEKKKNPRLAWTANEPGGYDELSDSAINYLAAFPSLLGVSATSETLKTHHTKEHHDPGHAAVTTETQFELSDSTQRR